MNHRLLLCLALLTTVATAQDGAKRQSSEHFTAEVKLKADYQYLLYLPDGYEADTQKKWPLVVFLHGAGERGTDLHLLYKHGPPKLIAAGQSFPAIVVSPQVLPNEIWNPHAVQALTDDIIRTHRVDVDRVYLTGISMGGFGTWETATEYPKTWAAIMPICGGAGVRFIMGERIKHIPEWIFHGAKDPVVDPAFSKRMNDVLTKLGASVKFTLYPDLQHDCWTVTYDNPEVWKWLFEQKRK
jgi:predicted peptidase